SGSGRCGASDSDVPVATSEIQRPKNQEERCPSVDAVREAHDARGGRDTATGKTRDAKDAEVAVLPWIDQALHAGSRGKCPPLAQTFGSGVVVGCVHRDAFLWAVVSATRDFLFLAPRGIPCAHAVQHTPSTPTRTPRECRSRVTSALLLIARCDNATARWRARRARRGKVTPKVLGQRWATEAMPVNPDG